MKKKNPTPRKRGKDPEIFDCFASRATIDGRRVLIGSKEAERIKAGFVWRGFLTKRGTPRRKLSWEEQLVIFLRETTTEPGYNHEFWGAEMAKPEWVRRTEQKATGGWLYFPRRASELTVPIIADRLGYHLTLRERQVEAATKDPAFLKKWEESEREQACRDLPPEDAAKVRIAVAGYNSLKDYAEEQTSAIFEFRQLVFQWVEKQAARRAHEFRKGFSAGADRAFAEDIESEGTEFRRREETFRILLEYWDLVSELPNRGELCRFLRKHYPPRMRRGLEFREDQPSTAWRNFTEFVRDLCDEIGLKLAGRGRPRKNTGTSAV